MAVQGPFLLCLLALASLYACTVGAKPSHYSMPFNRSSFPADFIFGVGSAAYQVYMHGLRSTFRLQLGWIFTLHANNKNKNENHIIWTLFPFFASLKEQLISMAGDLAYGILSPRNIQVSLSLFEILTLRSQYVQTCIYLFDLDLLVFLFLLSVMSILFSCKRTHATSKNFHGREFRDG